MGVFPDGLPRRLNFMQADIISKSPLATQEELLRAFRFDDHQIRLQIASNPCCSEQVMRKFLTLDVIAYLPNLARNPNASPEILEIIAQRAWKVHRAGIHREVLFALTENPSLPDDLRQRLSRHPDCWVKAHFAQIPNQPSAILSKMLDEILQTVETDFDSGRIVLRALARNPSLSSSDQVRIAQNFRGNGETEIILLENPSLTLEALNVLLSSSSIAIRALAGLAPQCSNAGARKVFRSKRVRNKVREFLSDEKRDFEGFMMLIESGLSPSEARALI